MSEEKKMADLLTETNNKMFHTIDELEKGSKELHKIYVSAIEENTEIELDLEEKNNDN